jgi:hypothetical protein
MPHISTRAVASALESKELKVVYGEKARLAAWSKFECPRGVEVEYFRDEVDDQIIYERARIAMKEYRGKVSIAFTATKLQKPMLIELVESDVDQDIEKLSSQMRADLQTCMDSIRTAFEKNRQP